MNKSVTSREQLLSAAKEIAYSQGLDQVNIRAVASRCGVAVGSIYNYFPTKADLIAAVIEDFWRATAHRTFSPPGADEEFSRYIERLYAQLRTDLDAFQRGWLEQVSAMRLEVRQKGRELEAKCFEHLKQGIKKSLDNDSRIIPGGPADEGEEFVDFVFGNIMLLLRSDKPDCAAFCRILRKLLY